MAKFGVDIYISYRDMNFFLVEFWSRDRRTEGRKAMYMSPRASAQVGSKMATLEKVEPFLQKVPLRSRFGY